MKIALISPRGAERNQQQDIMYDIYRDLEGSVALMTDDVEFIPNLALLTLAAYLPADWQAVFIEEDYVNPDEADELLFNSGFHLALISIVNYNALRGYEISDKLRKRGVYTVIGGLHASALPEEAGRHGDTVIVGEGEDVFQKFLKDYQKGEALPVYTMARPVDLTIVPAPRYELIQNVERFNKMPLFATRGCPHSCDFCVFPNVYAKGYRHKGVEQVVSEVERIIEIHPGPYLHFCDENLFCNRGFSKDLVRALNRFDVEWECFCDIGIADDDELLALLEQSRCDNLLIGLETVSPNVMKKVDPWKYGKMKRYKEDVRKIQGRGIPITGLFIVGFDGDGGDVFKNTRDFIADVGLFDMDFAILTPIPGSRLFDRLKKEGRIFSYDWSRYTWTRVNFQPMHMSAEELKRGLLWIFKEFASGFMLKKRDAHFSGVGIKQTGV